MSTIQPSDSAPPRVALTSEQDARFLADLVLKHSTGESTFVALLEQHEGTTRFANNQVVQNVNARRLSLSVTVAFGQQHGSASTSDCSVGAVRDALRRAEAVARLSPPDPEYLPPVSAQTYVTVPTWRAETDQAGYAGRAEGVRAAIGLSRNAGMQAAGIVSSSSSVVALAASTGLMAYESRTDARFSVTVTDGEATGWNASAHRSIARLEIAARTRAAVEKA
ncbi:MAG: PmbA/TldA family metallopeptidase, partial [Nitrospirales bacterium]